jgi:hypothetical protein
MDQILIGLDEGAPEAEVLVSRAGEMAVLVPPCARLTAALEGRRDVELRIAFCRDRNRLFAAAPGLDGQADLRHVANLPDDPKALFQTPRQILVAEIDVVTKDARDVGLFEASMLHGRHLRIR